MLRGKGWSWGKVVVVGDGGQPGTSENGLPELLNSDSFLGITFENSSQDQVQLERDGQDGAQKLGILQERAESRILG